MVKFTDIDPTNPNTIDCLFVDATYDELLALMCYWQEKANYVYTGAVQQVIRQRGHK
jgi:hypothetical protein